MHGGVRQLAFMMNPLSTWNSNFTYNFDSEFLKEIVFKQTYYKKNTADL